MAKTKRPDQDSAKSRIDLTSSSANELALDVDLSLVGAAPLIDALQNKGVTPARPNLFAFEDIYNSGNITHSARAWLELNEGDLHLSIRYRDGQPPRTDW
jgi:hypothetical protein